MKIDTEGRRHDDLYPKPAWLRQWLGHRTASDATIWQLTAQDFPLHNYTAIMRHAVDGDTMEVETVLREGERNGLGRVVTTERIRLLGYDAPERNEPGGTEATAALNALIPPGTRVYMHTYYDRRSFNRLLAWTYVDGSGTQLLDVAAAMVSGGHGEAA